MGTLKARAIFLSVATVGFTAPASIFWIVT